MAGRREGGAPAPSIGEPPLLFTLSHYFYLFTLSHYLYLFTISRYLYLFTISPYLYLVTISRYFYLVTHLMPCSLHIFCLTRYRSDNSLHS